MKPTRHSIENIYKKHLPNFAHALMAFWLKYKRNTLAAVGIIMAFFMIGVGILAPIIAPYNPLKLGDKTFVPPTLTWDLREHLFGTDDLGRDILSGSVFGIRISLIIGSLATVISLAVGVPLGAISGYFGGRIDDVLMRVTELFLVIPKLFLAIVLVAFFGSSLWNLILVLGVLSWPSIARLVRGQFLTLKERQFVEASRALGASERTIIFREILPNAMPPVIVNATLLVSSMILTEAGLSFLGLGDPTVMSLGTMLHNAQDFITRAWWMMLFPGLAIFIIALAITLVGEGLNEALNPRQIENK